MTKFATGGKNMPVGNQLDIDLLNRASLFTLSLPAWRNRRKADITKYETGADQAALRLSKRLLESEEYDKILEFQREVYYWCINRSMPSFLRNGIYVVSLNEVEHFEKKLAKSTATLAGILVPAFIKKYPLARESARAVLKEQWRAEDYPSNERVAAAFGLRWNWIYFGLPDNLPPQVRAREAAKLKKAYAEAQGEIVAALRAGFADLIAHAVDRLNVEPGKKKKVFKDSMLDRMKEFFETFDAKNLMQDDGLSEMVEQAKAILTNVDTETLRDNETVREQVAKKLGEVKAAVDVLVVEKPRRKFALDD